MLLTALCIEHGQWTCVPYHPHNKYCGTWPWTILHELSECLNSMRGHNSYLNLPISMFNEEFSPFFSYLIWSQINLSLQSTASSSSFTSHPSLSLEVVVLIPTLSFINPPPSLTWLPVQREQGLQGGQES